MPNIGSVLKSEIARVSRREMRQELASLRRSSVAYRRDIAALKRRVVDLERKASALVKERERAKATAAPQNESEGKGSRFQARGLRSLRQRLGISQAQLAKLIGVSGLTVYNWESGRASPRKERLAAIVALRKLGKRELIARLETRPPGKRAPAKRKRKARGRVQSQK